MSPVRLCSVAGCPNVAALPRARCAEHMRDYERERSARRREATRGTYKTKMWLSRRKAVMERDGGLCQDGRVCGRTAIAEEVDHVIPLDQGGAQYAMDNLRGTCRACHQAKTAAENRGPSGSDGAHSSHL